MDKSSITPGRHYAIREHPNEALQRVKILESVRRGKWRAEWVNPYPGLVDYVESRNIIVAWSERRAFVRDERNAETLAKTVEASGYPGPQHPVTLAVDIVLDATRERDVYLHRGILHYDLDALQRIADRARIDLPEHSLGYHDRHGRHHLPWDRALELAEAFARNEPATVLDPIDAQEHEWATRAHSPGESYLIDLLTDYRAGWAIVRQWAGHDAAVAAREARITELERLLVSVMWDLRRPKPDGEQIARRVERALHGG